MKARWWLFFYQSLTWTLLAIAYVAAPLLRHTKPKFVKWFRMRFSPEPLTFQPKLWVHAVSMGEIQIARALLNHHPHPEQILLTTVTQSGYQFLIDHFGRDRVRYLPWDVRRAYRKLFGSGEAPHLIVVETEIWPNLYAMMGESDAHLVIVNGRMSHKTLRWRRNPLYRKTLSNVDRLAVRSELDYDRYREFGVAQSRLSITGNIKYDFEPKALEPSPFRDWLETRERLVVFASISADEAELLAPAARTLLDKDGVSVVWAPRHLNQLDEHLTALSTLEPVQRSRMGERENARLLILDTFGELSGCYAHADLSLIGGSFNARGGQNFLESLQAGAPAVIGPSAENFRREVAEALDAKALIQLDGPEEVAAAEAGDVLRELLADQARLEAMSDAASTFIRKHKGAVARTLDLLLDLGVLSSASMEEI